MDISCPFFMAFMSHWELKNGMSQPLKIKAELKECLKLIMQSTLRITQEQVSRKPRHCGMHTSGISIKNLP